MTTPLTQKIIEQEAEFEKKYVVSFTEKDGSIYTDLIAELEPKDIILSRRQHLIELLEAEVEKWKGMLKEEDWNKIETGDYYAHEKVSTANKNKIYNQLLDLLITENEQTIKELKNI